jgi:Golgi nucleoside diphosphatase
MIDAGSTGSRIHVYKFNNCGPTPELEDEVFRETEKKQGGSGLSSYKEDAEGAAKSLDVLMNAAMEAVPDKLRSCTPVAVKATAGLRLLGQEMSEKILDAVRNRLETQYPFPVVSKEENGVVIMDGADEGVRPTTSFTRLVDLLTERPPLCLTSEVAQPKLSSSLHSRARAMECLKRWKKATTSTSSRSEAETLSSISIPIWGMVSCQHGNPSMQP